MTTILPFVDEGLGHSSYLVDLGDGRALVVDPPRIPDRADRRGSGARSRDRVHGRHAFARRLRVGQPRARSARRRVPRVEAARIWRYHIETSRAGDEIELRAGLSLRAIATPGHTPDHLAYLLCENGEPAALFSGGSLMVGTVGRTDLLGPEPREDLARQLYRALRDEILTLPDDLAVYPTHGAGLVLLRAGMRPSARRPSVANGRPTRCSPRPTRTASSSSSSPGSDRSRPTSRACPS